MALLKGPDRAVAVTITFPDPPEGIVIDEGSVPNEIDGVPATVAPHVEVNVTGPDI